jgi:riboflavin synthase
MFTGIVAGRARVESIEDRGGVRLLVLGLPSGLGEGLQLGASVSVAGTCLTVVARRGDEARFDCIDETLRRTTLGALGPGSLVNVERAARLGDEIGGHLLSGHVLGTAEVVSREVREENLALTLRAPTGTGKYLLPKGYVAVDGCSLTLGEVDRARDTFAVHLIPETRRVTTLDALRPGDRVNLEVDSATQAVVDTVERVLAERGVPDPGRSG